MTTQQIISITSKHFPIGIFETNIYINQYNKQIDSLEIIFEPDFTPDLKLIGNISDDIDDLVLSDDYGDLVQFNFKFNSYHQLPNEDQTVAWTFNFAIDS